MIEGVEARSHCGGGSGGMRVEDLCFAAASCQMHFGRRIAMVASSASDLIDKLSFFVSNWKEDGHLSGKKEGVVVGSKCNEKGVLMAFAGQGNWERGLGRALCERYPVYAKHYERCEHWQGIIAEEEGLEVREEEESGGRQQTETFMMEYSLAQLWISMGVQPTVLIGHSISECVAACIAGVFNLEDGMRFVMKRADLMDQVEGWRKGELKKRDNSTDGAMVAIRLGVQEVMEARE